MTASSSPRSLSSPEAATYIWWIRRIRRTHLSYSVSGLYDTAGVRLPNSFPVLPNIISSIESPQNTFDRNFQTYPEKNTPNTIRIIPSPA